MQKNKLVIYCDGGSRGNPGPAASAFVVTNSNTVLHKESKFLGNETNNVAEYSAVLLAVIWLSRNLILNSQSLIINLDSQLVERQLNGFYKIKNLKLKLFYNEIKKLILKKKLSIKFVWNFRDYNKLADLLVNEELDLNGKSKKFM
ncbi:MAG: Ribonuclease HI [Candidatus Woesebacteria bacterium GW2011_GWA1_33_30]|uniref:Ribonuclease HI n=1 Tax=Candidatus Woesebacteria bacterium GW2011_GWA2_33_28 TaxID=1618561 RepID=A0A0G0CT81_9BACT|nr:MAG: Ribonuclease HI [Candidatus Woesebacteria bacterium GW2011_GWA2_33_28]KKP47292.1 MAG: Ribonuclease HI [Candidatus Woesebacteria bacterium GW2011_GWA1_33_30]KKP48937.1 MAG: Ribonuclease HI [Microgenomates group bacterium GW2011_GWC1_33_32]KKP51475.1 MAG: Ribonuclease HI [Candidatus Woesebacteria bacterium GW2011_GWB1_33_38]KKP57478.1 MAG: Ribonuclease HI [Microgenomates group bacterium GW2011_GWD1_33_9]